MTEQEWIRIAILERLATRNLATDNELAQLERLRAKLISECSELGEKPA